MYILFLDDSLREKDKFVGIGGVILHDTCLSSICQLFEAVKEKYGIPSDAEIKWSPKRDNWIYNNLVDENRNSAYSTLLNLVKVCNGRAMVAIIRRDITPFNTKKAKWLCLEFVSERFQFFLQSQGDKNGIIIQDFPSNHSENKKLLNDYSQFRKKGTRYVKPSNIIMNLLTTESQYHPGLQIADLIIGVATAICTDDKGYASNFWPTVKANLHQSTTGNIIGCGLKVFPQESAKEVYARLFPEHFEKEYEEYIEEMRLLYSQVMSEDELNINFPMF
jgi:hypothetical protein